MARAPDTNISVIVVGAGIAGLSFAIEAYRNGYNVQVFERRSLEKSTGEMIVISNSALHTPKKWPGFMERAVQRASNAEGTFKKIDGTPIAPITLGDSSGKSLLINRGKLHEVLYEYALELGIPIEFNAPGKEFFETEDHGGVVLTDGRRLTADIVVAADGIGSKSWTMFAGTNTAPVSSGFVLYRITFPVAPALKNPIIAKELEGYKERGFFYAGPDAHFMTCMTGDDICWMLTCKDDNSGAKESWSKPTSIDKALKVVEGWEPFVPELIKATPDQTVFDWKMMWRDPQPQWVSPRGRVVQMGDAAHPFLPTSGAGATMAMEDAWSLASCLQITRKNNVPLATKVHNRLRFERVSCAQKMGFKNRELLHKTDWDAVAKNPEKMGNLFHNWIRHHDAEQYAYDNYAKCADHLLTGAPFENTNIVPGYKYKHWTVKELLEASAKGEPVHDEGDWA